MKDANFFYKYYVPKRTFESLSTTFLALQKMLFFNSEKVQK